MKVMHISLLVAAVLLCACGSSQYLGQVPVVEDQEQAARVTLVRCKAMRGALSPIPVQLDGKMLLEIKQGYTTSFMVSADEYNREHTLQIDMPFKDDPLLFDAPVDQVNLICEPGEEIFVVIDFSDTKNFLKRVSEEEARPCLEDAESM